MLDQTYLDTLKAIHNRLLNSNIIWFLIGTTNLALQGIDIKPLHLGILIHHKDLNKFLEIFSDKLTIMDSIPT